MESGNILAIPPSGDHPLSESSGDGNVWPVGHVNHELPPVRQVSESFALGDVAQPQPLPTEKLAARKLIDTGKLREVYWVIRCIFGAPNVVRSFCEASPDGTGMPREVEAVLQKYPEAFQAELLDFKPYDNEPSLRKRLGSLKLKYTYNVIENILRDPNVVKSFCEASPDGTGMPREVEAVLQKCSQEFQDEFLDFKPRSDCPSLRERLGRLKLECIYNVIKDILEDPNVIKSFCEASPDGTGMPREVEAVLQNCSQEFRDKLVDFKPWSYTPSLRERLGSLKLEYTYNVIENILKDPNVVKSFCEASPDGTGMPREVEAMLQNCSQEFRDKLVDFKPWGDGSSLKEKLVRLKLEYTYNVIENILKDPNVVKSFCEASPDGTEIPREVEAVLQNCSQEFRDKLLDFKPLGDGSSLKKILVRLKLEYTYNVIKGILKDPNVVRSFCEASPGGTGMPREVEAMLQNCSQEFRDKLVDFKPKPWDPSLKKILVRLRLEYTYNVIENILKDPNVVRSFCEASPDGTEIPREVEAVLQKCSQEFQDELFDFFKSWSSWPSLGEKFGCLKLEYTYKQGH